MIFFTYIDRDRVQVEEVRDISFLSDLGDLIYFIALEYIHRSKQCATIPKSTSIQVKDGLGVFSLNLTHSGNRENSFKMMHFCLATDIQIDRMLQEKVCSHTSAFSCVYCMFGCFSMVSTSSIITNISCAR